MRKILIYITSIFLLLTFSNCSKKNSSRWLLADVFVVNENTGLPLAGLKVKLFYWYDGFIGETQKEEISLGKTDENGYLKVEYGVIYRMSGFQIGTETSNNSFKKVKVYVKKKNIVVLPL